MNRGSRIFLGLRAYAFERALGTVVVGSELHDDEIALFDFGRRFCQKKPV